MPAEIISDRDKLFISKFWKSLVARLGVEQKLSTAYHPQTDGQTERTNQTLEAYLTRSEEHTSELQSHHDLVCRLLLEKKNQRRYRVPLRLLQRLSARRAVSHG